MIDELHIQNVALIKDITFNPSDHLTVITGETGSGESALLSAIKLLVGRRADSSQVRDGSGELVVEGRIYLDDGILDGHVVRRHLANTGKGKCYLDGSMSTVGQINNTIGRSVDICGQNEHQKLLDPVFHLYILDAFGKSGISPYLDNYKDAYHEYKQAIKALNNTIKQSSISKEVVEQQRFILNKINEVNPSMDEYVSIKHALPKAEHAESLLTSCVSTKALLEDEACIQDLLNQAISSLNTVEAYDSSLEELSNRLKSCLVDLEDISLELGDYIQGIDLDIDTLDKLQSRLASIQGLLRVYGPGLEDVINTKDKAEDIIKSSDNSKQLIKDCETRLDEATNRLEEAADNLDNIRLEVAPKLCSAIMEQMVRLDMKSARLKFDTRRLNINQYTQDGPSEVELLYSPGPDMLYKPLKKIASGGEISRVMLGIKVVLGASDSVDTLIFDEVDAGVGGAVAISLAQVLKDISTTHQTIVVTHLPQIAAVADKHYVVTKVLEPCLQTKLELVEGKRRIEEIARMLSGRATKESLAHASQMLESTRG